MPYVGLPDTTLYYTDQGVGPPLVLVHGYTCDSVDWTWSLPKLLEHFRVIAFDRRGEGRSAPAADLSMDRQVGDVEALVDRLGCEAPIVVGHSLGGAIVSCLAVERPGLASAIVVLDPPYAAEPEFAAIAEAMKDALQGHDPHQAVKDLWRQVCYTDASPGWFKVLVDRRIDLMTRESLYGGYIALWEHPGGIAFRPTADAYLARRNCPVFAIHTIRSMADYERRSFSDPRSQAVDWEGTGHWLQVERPLDTAEAIIEWASNIVDLR
jgi:pimeloyl-ACP methyl ester carboxylesterase